MVGALVFVFGLIVAVFGGHGVVSALFSHLYRNYRAAEDRPDADTRTLQSLVGMLERIIYFTATWAGDAWELVGGWLVLKAVADLTGRHPVRGYYMYLIGNAASLICGVGAALLTLWALRQYLGL